MRQDEAERLEYQCSAEPNPQDDGNEEVGIWQCEFCNAFNSKIDSGCQYCDADDKVTLEEAMQRHQFAKSQSDAEMAAHWLEVAEGLREEP